MTGTNYETQSDFNSRVKVSLTNSQGLVILGSFTGNVPTETNQFAPGCILIKTDAGSTNTIYINEGSDDAPDFTQGTSVNSIPSVSYWDGNYTDMVSDAIDRVFSVKPVSAFPSFHQGVAHGESIQGYFAFACLLFNGWVFLGNTIGHTAGASYFGLYNPATNTYTRAGNGLDANGNIATSTTFTVAWDDVVIGTGGMTCVEPSATYPSGLVVIAAYSGTTFKPLRYNPATNTFIASTVTDASNLFGGTSPMPDGRVFFAPYTTGPFAFYDPVADTISTLTNTVGNGFESAQLLPNGTILCTSRSSAGNNALYTIATNTVAIVDTNTASGSHGIALTKNGKAIIIPTSPTAAIRIYNWKTGTFSDGPTLAGGGSSVGWGNIHTLSDGRVLATARTAANHMIYDPEANTVTYLAHGNQGSNRWLGSVAIGGGKIICAPNTARNTIDWIETHGAPINDFFTRRHPVWNKF